jgi:hypothetical protein
VGPAFPAQARFPRQRKPTATNINARVLKIPPLMEQIGQTGTNYPRVFAATPVIP